MAKSDGADHVKTALRMSIMNERVLQSIVTGVIFSAWLTTRLRPAS